MGTYGLTLHPDKTRLLSFGRPSKGQQAGKGLASFDFLVVTLYWTRPDMDAGSWHSRPDVRASRGARAARARPHELFWREREHP